VTDEGLNADQVRAFLDEVSPGVTEWMIIEQAGDRTARVRMTAGPERLRPGGIVSGPALMSLADASVWVAVLGVIGPVAMSVTFSLTIHFFRPTPPGDVVAEARLHQVGPRLATGDVLLFADGEPEPVAHATVTYSIPSRR
jgi:uncharacterized protein (TIGR00369 family)